MILKGNFLDSNGEYDTLHSENLAKIMIPVQSLGYVDNNNVFMNEVTTTMNYNDENNSIEFISSTIIGGSKMRFSSFHEDVAGFIDELGSAIRQSTPFENMETINKKTYECLVKCKEAIDDKYPNSIVLNFTYNTPGYIYSGDKKVGTFDGISIGDNITLFKINLSQTEISNLKIKYYLRNRWCEIETNNNVVFNELSIMSHEIYLKRNWLELVKHDISECKEERDYDLFFTDKDEFIISRNLLINDGATDSGTTDMLAFTNLDFEL